MAVESRFVVIRHGVEAKTFMDKKSADEYDKMLDMADNLADVFNDSSIELDGNLCEELSIYLAQHREDVLVALLAKKPPAKAAKKTVAKADDKAVSASSTSEVKSAIEAVEKAVGSVAETPAKSPKKAKAKSVKLSEAS